MAPMKTMGLGSGMKRRLTPSEERARNLARWRVFKHRAFKSLGWIEVKVLVTPEMRDALIDAGRLDQWDEDDHEAVTEAIQKVLETLKPIL